MSDDAPTHSAYTLRRESRTRSRWIEIGHARIVGGENIHHILLDRLPTGGWTGHLCLSPVGVKPPEPEPQPTRPFDNGDP